MDSYHALVWSAYKLSPKMQSIVHKPLTQNVLSHLWQLRPTFETNQIKIVASYNPIYLVYHISIWDGNWIQTPFCGKKIPTSVQLHNEKLSLADLVHVSNFKKTCSWTLMMIIRTKKKGKRHIVMQSSFAQPWKLFHSCLQLRYIICCNIHTTSLEELSTEKQGYCADNIDS